MKLVIAEKPNYAKNIISAIGHKNFQKKDGYFESAEYIVTWSFGHLFELYDLEEYLPQDVREEKPKWTLEGLPFRPQEFRYALKKDKKTKKVDPGVKKQFSVIKMLCGRSDVDSIVNAGDADREGEVIIRLLLKYAGNTKPVYRLWTPDQTADTIRRELKYMRPDSDYDALANEGFARTEIDWLYGINLTRLATLKSGTLQRVGRVIVPIVKAIYDRDMEIRNFKPIPYIIVSSDAETNGEKIHLVSKKKFPTSERAAAQEYADELTAKKAIVTDLKSEVKEIAAGKLLNQSSLQALAGKKYKLAPIETLEIAQKLYEAGYATYPRTPIEYLATSEIREVNRVIEVLQEKGYKVISKDDKKTIYDDSKIKDASHTAIRPTHKIPDKDALSDIERKIYDLILNRFLAVFCSEPCKVNHSVLTIVIGDEQFNLSGNVYLQKGWMQYDDTNRNDKVLPKLVVGDEVNTAFVLEDKETKPPAHYTVKSLGDFLCNPFRKKKTKALFDDEESETEEQDSGEELFTEEELPDDTEDYEAIMSGLEIGTEATRAGIINNAVKSKYISLKNNVYTILPGGEYLIECLNKLQIDMGKEKTAQMGRNLKRVYNGEISIEDAVTLAFREVRQCFTASAGITLDRADIPKGLVGAAPEVIGKCPKCNADVVERKKLFGCTNKECGFALWKENKFLESLGKEMTKAAAKGFLSKGQVKAKNCVSQKSGKTFDCVITADFSGDKPKYSITFPDKKPRPKKTVFN